MIEIPRHMKALDEALKSIPSWAEICRQRDEEQKKSRERSGVKK